MSLWSKSMDSFAVHADDEQGRVSGGLSGVGCFVTCRVIMVEILTNEVA